MTGQMTKADAATAMSAVHLQQYNDALKQLQEQRAAIESNSHISDMERKAQLNNNSAAQGTLNANYQMQSAQDRQNINPASSSGSVGFNDALNEFVNASRDAATQMRDLTANTLKGLNDQLVAGMSGQKTDFKGFGAGVFRNVAGLGLSKAEGALIPGLQKLGSSASNPMFVKFADGVGGAVSGIGSGIGGIFSKLFGGGSSSTGGGSSNADGLISGLGSAADAIIPFLATGGPINGPAIVGENGPELYVPNSSGSIVPNHKLSGIGSGGGITFHPGAIDARGAGDPAQVEAAVHRGIMQAAPHIMAGAVQMGKSIQQRKPNSMR